LVAASTDVVGAAAAAVAVAGEPLVVVAGKSAAGYVIEPFNPLTGASTAAATVIQKEVTLVVEAPVEDETGTKVLLLLDVDKHVHTFPATAGASAAVAVGDARRVPRSIS
jgi:hypothetical protein